MTPSIYLAAAVEIMNKAIVPLVLIVTLAIGGCTVYTGAKPNAVKVGKTSKDELWDVATGLFKEPDESTEDGRFFFYRFEKDTLLFFVPSLIGACCAFGTSKEGRLLIEFDEHDTVKRYVVHQCGKKAPDDPICAGPVEHTSLVAMLEKYYGAPVVRKYRKPVALCKAAKRSDRLRVEALLIEGIDVNTRCPEVGTALHAAVLNPEPEVAEVLLGRGADVNAKDPSGNTPLHVATLNGHVSIVRALITHGADVSAKNLDRGTPLHGAASRGESAVVQLLLAHGADVNATDTEGDTPLHEAAFRHGGIVKLLIAHGADIRARNLNGNTPLHEAVYGGSQATVEALLAAGADANESTQEGNTLLHVAVWQDQAGVVEVLLAHRTDVNARDAAGETPLKLAERLNRESIAKLLRQYGASK